VGWWTWNTAEGRLLLTCWEAY